MIISLREGFVFNCVYSHFYCSPKGFIPLCSKKKFKKYFLWGVGAKD